MGDSAKSSLAVSHYFEEELKQVHLKQLFLRPKTKRFVILLLCILTKFWVLHVPESWLKWFSDFVLLYIYFSYFLSFLSEVTHSKSRWNNKKCARKFNCITVNFDKTHQSIHVTQKAFMLENLVPHRGFEYGCQSALWTHFLYLVSTFRTNKNKKDKKQFRGKNKVWKQFWKKYFDQVLVACSTWKLVEIHTIKLSMQWLNDVWLWTMLDWVNHSTKRKIKKNAEIDH